jgi:hypothetical protein
MLNEGGGQYVGVFVDWMCNGGGRIVGNQVTAHPDTGWAIAVAVPGAATYWTVAENVASPDRVLVTP